MCDMELSGSPVKKAGNDPSPGAPAVGSKFVGPGHAETVHASENFDKAGLVAAHIAALHDASMLERGLLPGTSLPDSEAPPIPPVYVESPWKDLKAVSLADMKVGKTHRRHVLEGCLCVKSLKINSVVNVLEEDSGLATKLILTNAVPLRASMAQAQCCYPEGARVAVRDPYLTRFPDGMVGVLVERPVDIAFLSRPESNGENGTTKYESVGHEGYPHDDRDSQSASLEHESFSRKLHLFEQQSNSESLHSEGISDGHEKFQQLAMKAVLFNKQVPVQQDIANKIRNLESLDDLKESPSTKCRQGIPWSKADSEVITEEAPSVSVEEVSENKLETSTPPEADDEAIQEKAIEEEVASNSTHEKESVVTEQASPTSKIDESSAPEADSIGLKDDALFISKMEVSTVSEVDVQVPDDDVSMVASIDEDVQQVLETPQNTSGVSETKGLSAGSNEEVHTDKKDRAEELHVQIQEDANAVGTKVLDEDKECVVEIPKNTSELNGGEVLSELLDQERCHNSGSEADCNEEVHEGEEDEVPRGSGSTSVEEHDQIAETSEPSSPKDSPLESAEGVSEVRTPILKKRFQRSDSLLAVQESEDSRARASDWAPGAAVLDKYSKVKTGDSALADASNILEDKPQSESESVLPQESTPQSSSDASTITDPLESASANDLRVVGNQLFADEDFLGATELYTKSICRAEKEEQRLNGSVCASEVLLGYSNRAEAWIRLNRYEMALEDAQNALSRDPNHLKSLFRKGRALLGLGQYEDALSTLQVAAPRAPSDKDLQLAMHESNIGIQQSRQGLYDLSNYYLKGKHSGEVPVCADYLGPVVVSDVGRGRGRGLVLTKDVEAGELLLVSNPLAFLPLQGLDQTRDEISQAFVSGKVQEQFRKIYDNTHSSNRSLQKLPMLFDGERTLPPPPEYLLSPSSAGVSVKQEPLDANRIRRIIQLNAINGNATMGWKNLPGSGEQDQKVEHWGLWWLPSFINHSCLPSSSPILVGRALFVFASRDLRAGDEVTRSYFDVFQPLEQRRELSTKGWGFVCHCPRCKLEDALHVPLSRVTKRYTKLMELASRSKTEYVSDEKLSETQTSAALKFFQKLESKLKDFKLNAAENNWVRSSFLHYIDMISGDHELHPHLESVVEAMGTVCPGSETTLHMAVVAKDSARRTRGKKSVQFKSANQRALNICRSTYGKQRLSLLQSIVDKSDYQV